ncbi:unnamed protein product, partial [Pylaiella littoralis]
ITLTVGHVLLLNHPAQHVKKFSEPSSVIRKPKTEKRNLSPNLCTTVAVLGRSTRSLAAAAAATAATAPPIYFVWSVNINGKNHRSGTGLGVLFSFSVFFRLPGLLYNGR